MKLLEVILVLAVLGTTAIPAPAGPIQRFFQKRREQKQTPTSQKDPNPQYPNQPYPSQVQPLPAQPVVQPAPLSPAQRVNQLVSLARTGGDENQRQTAATELRQYDPQAYPQIVPTLIDVLRTDSSANVRGRAAESLGKLRPISNQVGNALQQAANSDASNQVRWQARTALTQYQMSGYRPIIPGQPTTSEPPLAEPLPARPQPVPTPKLIPAPAAVKAPIATPPVQAQPVSRPVPTPPVPVNPPAPMDDGPILGPPQ
jgi:hypothetical protein